jgi:DNA-binding MarR family transcriptional regulator
MIGDRDGGDRDGGDRDGGDRDGGDRDGGGRNGGARHSRQVAGGPARTGAATRQAADGATTDQDPAGQDPAGQDPAGQDTAGQDTAGQVGAGQDTAGQVGARPPEVLASQLGFLLKHAQLRLAEAGASALAPFGINGRELAILVLLAAEYPLSQLETAVRLGVDRTTMVAVIDDLEDKGLVQRHRSPQDRRKNIVELTWAGLDCLRQGEQARVETERRFLAPLGETEADQLVRALQIVNFGR